MFCFSLRKGHPGCSSPFLRCPERLRRAQPSGLTRQLFSSPQMLRTGLLSLAAPERACFTVYFGRLNITRGAHFTKCLYFPLSCSCMLFPSSITLPKPEKRQGRKEGCGKTCFSTVCEIKGSISPRVHLHRENSQPCLHIVIMTRAINAPSLRHCAQRDDRGAAFLQRAVLWTKGVIPHTTSQVGAARLSVGQHHPGTTQPSLHCTRAPPN